MFTQTSTNEACIDVTPHGCEYVLIWHPTSGIMVYHAAILRARGIPTDFLSIVALAYSSVHIDVLVMYMYTVSKGGRS